MQDSISLLSSEITNAIDTPMAVRLAGCAVPLPAKLKKVNGQTRLAVYLSPVVVEQLKAEIVFTDDGYDDKLTDAHFSEMVQRSERQREERTAERLASRQGGEA